MGWIEAIVQAGTQQIGAAIQYKAAKDKLWKETERAEETLNRNATIAEGGAADAQRRGQEAASQRRSMGAQLSAQQQVAASASGVNPNSGSVVSTIAGTQQLVELDARTEETNAAREAWGFERKAAGLRNQAVQVRKDANETSTSLDIGLVLGLLTPGANAMGTAADQAYSNKNSNVASDTSALAGSTAGASAGTQAAADSGGGAGAGAGATAGADAGWGARGLVDYDLNGRPKIQRG